MQRFADELRNSGLIMDSRRRQSLNLPVGKEIAMTDTTIDKPIDKANSKTKTKAKKTEARKQAPSNGILMPVGFGSPASADQPTESGLAASIYPRSSTTASISFLTDRKPLEAMLPKGKQLELRGEPTLTVTAIYGAGDLRAWAGKTYEIVMVSIPVTFNGKTRQVHGEFAPIVLENLADPIIAGRELLGWSKVYAEIEPPRVVNDCLHSVAGWGGFNFMDLRIKHLKELTAADIKRRQQQARSATLSEGSIHHKYIRRTGTLDEADADYLTMSTSVNAPETRVRSFGTWTGEGSIEFHAGTWRELPMMIRPAINALARLKVKQVLRAEITRTEMISSGGMGRTIILE